MVASVGGLFSLVKRLRDHLAKTEPVAEANNERDHFTHLSVPEKLIVSESVKILERSGSV
jgi:hypothetical protein